MQVIPLKQMHNFQFRHVCQVTGNYFAPSLQKKPNPPTSFLSLLNLFHRLFSPFLREFRPAPRSGSEPQVEEYGEDWSGQAERWDRLRDQPEASSATNAQQAGVPVYVMLPLDSVWVRDVGGKIVSMVKRERALQIGLRTLKRAGVKGVMIDVWWGIVERDGPRQYDFAAYRRLFELVRDSGLKVQVTIRNTRPSFLQNPYLSLVTISVPQRP